MSKLIFLILVLFASLSGQYKDILESYIATGLKENLALREKTFSLARSEAALDEARGLFFPSLDLNARYSRAEGGRTIDIPVGDLMAPVFGAINLTRVQSGLTPLDFPTVENEHINFLREKEQYTTLRLQQPIFNLKIVDNYNAKNEMLGATEMDRLRFARHLVFEIKKAYFNYLQSEQVVKIFQRSEEVVRENLRVSESLFANDKVTKDVVYRAKAELSEITQKRDYSITQRDLARQYFNFLLNRDLEETIVSAEVETITFSTYLIEDGRRKAIADREELMQLGHAVNAADYGRKIAFDNYIPTLNFAFDFGYQGENYNFNDEQQFWMASGVLQWNLFNGLQDKAKVEQGKAQTRELETRQQLVEKQIILEVDRSWYNMDVAKKIHSSASERVQSAQASFNLKEKKFNEGVAPQLEYLDARSSATSAALSEAIAKFGYLVAEAEYEKAIAAYPIGEKVGRNRE